MQDGNSTAAGIGAFIALIVVNALLSASLSALMNVRKPTLRERAEHGERRARRVLTLAEDSTRLLAIRQLVNILLHFAGAAITMLSIDAVFGTEQPLALDVAFLAVGGILMLLFGELLPTAVAAQNADRVAAWLFPLISPLIAILWPVSALLLAISQRLAALFGGKQQTSYVTEEEIKTLVDAGQEEGVIEDDEKEMIYSIFQFTDKVVREVMVPRIDIVALPTTATLQQALETVLKHGHSRIPVYDTTIDRVVGVLYAKDLLRGPMDHSRTAKDIMRPAYFVPESKGASELLEELQRRKVHMAIVIDEYGGTAGIVTIEDLLEEIVGEIQDEYDPDEEAKYQQIGPNEYRVDGGMNLDEFNELLGVELSTEESDTLGGYILSMLGKVPQVGEMVEQDNLRLIVESVAGRRIEWVRAIRLASPPEPPSEAKPAPAEPTGEKRATRTSSILPS